MAVVTGGASGIGAATVQRLVDGGWRVAVLDRAAEPGVHLQVDVRDGDAVAAAFTEVCDRWGDVDAVVHCAAIAQRGESVAELSVDQFRELVDVDLVGSYAVARAAADAMRTGGGAIVLVSSGSGIRARRGMAGYGAAKAGVIHLTKLLAVELGSAGIRVNCVSPGVTLTPLMLDAWGAADSDQAFAMADAQAPIPIGRLVTADEVAAAACYLVSPDAGAITGHNLVVDGGRSL
ncbi:MAG: SDR family oxidoreductase [Streptosporangiales bacterium]|nr:SDR family oxidoreductase [Streptosporangiales bacterium]